MFSIIRIVKIGARVDASTIPYEFVCSILTEITSAIDFFEIIRTCLHASKINHIRKNIIPTHRACVDTPQSGWSRYFV